MRSSLTSVVGAWVAVSCAGCASKGSASDSNAVDAGTLDGGSVDAGDANVGSPEGSTPTAATPVDASSPFALGVPGTIAFSPPDFLLDNPASAGATTVPQTATFTLTVTDRDGGVVTPTPSTPIELDVYGPSVVSPTTTTVTSNAPVTFTYDGGYFSGGMTINASMPSVGGGRNLGTAQLVPKNASCAIATGSVALPLHCAQSPCTGAQAIESGLDVAAAIGGGASHVFEIDTGSLGVVVPASELGPQAIGPGPAGVKFYDSDGYEFFGDYYLSPVTFADASGAAHTTVPILVLGTTSTSCHSGYPSCTPPANTIHLLGVGFDRNGTEAGDLFNGPTANPFLQLEEEVVTNAIRAGYVLSAGSTRVGSLAVLGVTTALEGAFSTYPLTANGMVPGDWIGAAACFGFPSFGTDLHCGQMLVDVGYGGMFLELPTADRPASFASVDPPSGTMMTIVAPASAGTPALSYSFTYTASAPASSGAAPTSIAWSGTTATFVNTGRHLLSAADYLVDTTCGVVGFAPSDAASH
jgi:hypothetical protein